MDSTSVNNIVRAATALGFAGRDAFIWWLVFRTISDLLFLAGWVTFTLVAKSLIGRAITASSAAGRIANAVYGRSSLSDRHVKEIIEASKAAKLHPGPYD